MRLGKKSKYKELVADARRAKEKAYAPYSNFRVGAALQGASGRIYTGCNVENSSFGLTVCAERVAIFKAISEGEREFTALALSTDTEGFTPPCGACRQVLLELAGDIDIVLSGKKDSLKTFRLKSLIPLAFTSDDLKRNRR